MDQELLSQLKAGDIVLYGGNKFVSKAIQFFMRIQRRKQGLPVPKGIIASHAGTLVNIWDQLYIAEALENGIVVSPFAEAYKNKFENIKILTPKKAYSTLEGEKISKYAVEDSLTPHRYDFFGLWFQAKMIFKGEWSGPKGDKADKRYYCTEAVANWANKVRPGTFTQEEATGPLEIEFNKYYKVIYDGEKIG
jgi:hypothetical protein